MPAGDAGGETGVKAVQVPKAATSGPRKSRTLVEGSFDLALAQRYAFGADHLDGRNRSSLAMGPAAAGQSPSAYCIEYAMVQRQPPYARQAIRTSSPCDWRGRIWSRPSSSAQP
jgi:hypothetical protein